MAGSASDFLENKILDHIVGKTAYPMPTAYVALCTADPADPASGSGINEVANSNNYARKATAGGDWNAASGGATSNANAITFNQASGSWGTVTHFCLCSSGTWGEGHVIVHGDLTTPKAIDNGDTPEFAAGELDITCD